MACPRCELCLTVSAGSSQAEHHRRRRAGWTATGWNLSQLAAAGKNRLGLSGPAQWEATFTRNSRDGCYQLWSYRGPLTIPILLLGHTTWAILAHSGSLPPWASAVKIASPLRRLTVALERVAGGDLTARQLDR